MSSGKRVSQLIIRKPNAFYFNKAKNCAYFSESFLCADGVDNHSISNACHHCQHVETDARSDACRQLNIVSSMANAFGHIIQICDAIDDISLAAVTT